MPNCQPFDSAVETRLILRYLELRKTGAVEIILVECGVYYRCESQVDPWGSKIRISLAEFETLLDRATERPKPIRAERGTAAEVECAA
jgi:hypothetical protein